MAVNHRVAGSNPAWGVVRLRYCFNNLFTFLSFIIKEREGTLQRISWVFFENHAKKGDEKGRQNPSPCIFSSWSFFPFVVFQRKDKRKGKENLSREEREGDENPSREERDTCGLSKTTSYLFSKTTSYLFSKKGHWSYAFSVLFTVCGLSLDHHPLSENHASACFRIP